MRKRDVSPLSRHSAPYGAELQELEGEVVSSKAWWRGGPDPLKIPIERTVDVLSFGVDSFPRPELRQEGIVVVGMTALTLSDINHAGVKYANRGAFRLAVEVSPNENDIVVINRDIAFDYARALSNEMIPRTLVVDDYFHHEEGQVDDYETDFGITNFSEGSRDAQARKIIEMRGVLPAVVRPVRPDVRIRTLWPLEVTPERWDDVLV